MPVVDVAQVVELQVVALAAAGSSPVVHPRPSRPAREAGPDGVDGVIDANAVRVWRNW